MFELFVNPKIVSRLPEFLSEAKRGLFDSTVAENHHS